MNLCVFLGLQEILNSSRLSRAEEYRRMGLSSKAAVFVSTQYQSCDYSYLRAPTLTAIMAGNYYQIVSHKILSTDIKTRQNVYTFSSCTRLLATMHAFGIDLCHSSQYFWSHTAKHILISGHSKFLEPGLSKLVCINQKKTSSSLALRSQTHTSYITWLYMPCAIEFSRTCCIYKLFSVVQFILPRFHTFFGVILSHKIKSHWVGDKTFLYDARFKSDNIFLHLVILYQWMDFV